MANIASGIAAVLLALSAFYAYKNKEAVATLNDEIVAQESKIAKNKDNLADVQNENGLASEELVTVTADTETLSAELETAQTEDQELTAQITSKKEQVEANFEKISEARKGTDGLDSVDDLLLTVTSNEDELELLQNEIANNQAKLSLLQKSVESKKVQLADLRARKASTSEFRSLDTLNTSIRVAMNRHGFVILNGGDNAGIVANSPLNVVRGGEVVAKLKVTTVEASTAAASVIPDSKSDDVILRSGDRVVSSAPEVAVSAQ